MMSRTHRKTNPFAKQLFDTNLPFGAKTQRNRKKYKREEQKERLRKLIKEDLAP